MGIVITAITKQQMTIAYFSGMFASFI
jgi:hypothetical protein